MNNRSYSLTVGIVMIIASLLFFTLPVFFNIDAFIPVMMAIASFLVGIAFFFMGHSGK